MVRLLRERLKWIAEMDYSFQSHNGAIAAKSYNQPCGEVTLVSIPQWCDCCINDFSTADYLTTVSIPQWCDCCQGKIWGFGGKMGQNERGVAVDLRLPEEPKGVDGK